jgi:hypothetical protein
MADLFRAMPNAESFRSVTAWILVVASKTIKLRADKACIIKRLFGAGHRAFQRRGRLAASSCFQIFAATVIKGC